MAPYFSNYSLLKNIGIAALLTDETFGVASLRTSRGMPINDRWMIGLNVTAYVVWIASCVVGGLFGSWITDPAAFGLDFALTAMFIALLILQIDTTSASKLWHHIRLIILTVIAVYLLSSFLSIYIAVLLATMICATIGVLTEK